MHRNFIRTAYNILIPFLFCFLLASCKTTKSIPYFADFPDSSKPLALKTIPFTNPEIKPDDILSVTIQTIDNTVTQVINTTNVTNAGVGPQAVSGYLVNDSGFIELPFVGKIKVSGYSTSQAQEVIRIAAEKYFNNPVVNVRYVNFKITILGDVIRPSSYVLPNEKVTIFDALGLAGDMTIYGKRENVLLIRDSANNNRQMVRLNLNSKDIISSPYYYLKPNDMIYIEPNSSKIATSDAVKFRYVTVVTAAVSVVALLIRIL